MTRDLPGSGLRGRRRECEVLDHVLSEARAGRSAVLVLHGEAGIGKTALLEQLVKRATGCHIARASGVEPEMELAFAGLQQFCAPYQDRLEQLPGPQRDALGTAFGLQDGPAPDRFLVGLAVLSLLSGVAEERPLVCVVDDAQWLDRASAQTLAFVARRLAAEAVAMVLAVRERDLDDGLAGLPDLAVPGLAPGDARDLLDSVVTGPLDARVRERILTETRGNPLALVELPRGRTPAELAGGFGIPDTIPLAGRLEQGFLLRLGTLPAPTRLLLLAAAAEPVGDVVLLWRAARLLGIGVDAAAPAEEAGLIEIGARVRFRHPLVRSAVCRAAAGRELRQVHHALAESTDPEMDPDRRAWHRAQAAAGPDESVAVELERSAGRAQARGGVAAAAGFLQRATELTPDAGRRGARALAAAQTKFDASAPAAALDLLAIAEMCPLDALQRALLQRLRAQLVIAHHHDGGTPSALLLEAAKQLDPLDAELARETYLDALRAAVFAGRLGRGDEAQQVAQAALAASPVPRPPRAVDLLLHGLAVRFTEGLSPAVVPLRRALEAVAAQPLHDERRAKGARLLWLAWPVAYELWDDEVWHGLTLRLVAVARDLGALTVLPLALVYRAQLHVQAGEFAAATALLDEVDLLKKALGETPLIYTSTTTSARLVLASWKGEEEQALELIDDTLVEAAGRREGRAISLAEFGRAVLHNGLGRYDLAFAAARRASEHDDLGLHPWALVELIEAAARSGRAGEALVALRSLAERTRAADTDWALGVEARCRALVSTGAVAEDLYEEAVERLTRTRIRVALARAHLLYGEWLRREGRRTDARAQLRTAHAMLSEIGMGAFAERARRELLATGETARKRTLETRDDLTPQEVQIAWLAADGATNTEIGGQMFISARTVEWHLHKVFAKLRIASRRQLRRALVGVGRAPARA